MFKKLFLTIVTTILIVGIAFAGAPLHYPLFQVLDSNGDPVSGGLVYTYATGTTTPKVAYTDSALSVAATNPIVLDSKGEATFYLDGEYRINVTTSAAVQVTNFPMDNIYSFGDVAGYDTGTASGEVPLNSDLGTVAILDHGTSSGEVPLNSDKIVIQTIQTSTSGTSISFTSLPPGTKRITVMLVGVSTNGTSDILLQLGDSGGVETSGYLSGGSNLSSTFTYTTGFGSPVATAAAIRHGQIIFSLVDASTFTWVANGCVSRSDTAGIRTTSGSKSLSAELDRLILTTVNGTDVFDLGSINVSCE